MAPETRGEFDTLLASVDYVEGELAKELLASAGIPSMMHTPDFDVAELGLVSHAQIRHGDLLVPRGARATARAKLVEAWGEAVVARHDPPASASQER
jgi:hypothetical protein